jgi:hypothetical protein
VLFFLDGPPISELASPFEGPQVSVLRPSLTGSLVDEYGELVK